MPTIESSRSMILGEIGDAPDLTLVRGVGSRGDQLIAEGTRRLLADRTYREIDLESLCAARGHTALLTGSGGFCRPFHELMPRALAVAGLRFDRVIVLPSSFDPSEDEVREALVKTRATVFARERESYRRIAALCDARLAHDCSFFFDFASYRAPGKGTLNAFRSDREATSGRSVPGDNDDISLTETDLQSWLARIAQHELIRTDRAHVMIAGAMLGKRVEFVPSNYHKLPAIAQYALTDYPVTQLASLVSPRAKNSQTPSRSPAASPSRVTAVVLSRDRPELALQAVDSLRRSTIPAQAVLVDNNSAPAAAQTLLTGCDKPDGAQLRRSDRNHGCAGGRRLAIEEVDSDLVLFLDDDAELEAGALDLLVAELDANPHAAAVTATVLLEDGTVQHSGGWMRAYDSVVEFGPIGDRQRLDHGTVPPSGPADWVPGTVVLIRREVLDQFPIDRQMASYYEDNEWCYRVELSRPGSFRRSLEARAVHHRPIEPPSGTIFALRSCAVERLYAQARFYQRHGKLLDVNEFDLVPELRDTFGRRDIAAARLMMELLLANGKDWTFMEWMNGNLEGLLSAGRRLAAHRAELAEQADRIARQQQTINAQSHELVRQTQAIAEQADTLAFLRGRHDLLEQVESSDTWRLHERLVPVLSPLISLRERQRRR